VLDMCISKQSGYSLIEAMIVLIATGILAVATVPLYDAAIRSSNSEAAAQLIAQELSYARALAVSNHGNILVQFNPTNRTLVVAPGTGSARGPFSLPAGVQFLTAAPVTDTPDGLGSTVLGVGGNSQMVFLDNGSVIDDPVNNNIRSGTFFLRHVNNDPSTVRAVTLMGGTGRVHTWRWDDNAYAWK
jgi:Tfp pilus assembly protein FimT